MNSKTTPKPSPLGRGLSALFGDADASYQPRPPIALATPAPVQPVAKEKAAANSLPIEWLQPGAYQPRRFFDEEHLKELAASIRERGVLQPLLVRPIQGEPNAYEIVAGERRWRACQLAGVHEVPVVIRTLTDREAMEFGLIENVQREGLSLVEEAEGYKRLLEEFQHSYDGLAKIVGKNRTHIASLIRFLDMPEGVKNYVAKGDLTLGHVKSLLNARDPMTVATEIVKRGLSVRQAEDMARHETDKKKVFKPAAKTSAVDSDILALEKDLTNATGLKIKLNVQGKGGSVVVHYQNLDQLDEIVKRLKG